MKKLIFSFIIVASLVGYAEATCPNVKGTWSGYPWSCICTETEFDDNSRLDYSSIHFTLHIEELGTNSCYFRGWVGVEPFLAYYYEDSGGASYRNYFYLTGRINPNSLSVSMSFDKFSIEGSLLSVNGTYREMKVSIPSIYLYDEVYNPEPDSSHMYHYQCTCKGKVRR